MLSKVIGIISYFPENKVIKENRKSKLYNLLKKATELFNLPIIIISQNWNINEVVDVEQKFQNCFVYQHKEPLGITGARKELRKIFLNSNYDYLIMCDDDIELFGNSGKEYLKQIDDNPGCFIENTKSRLQLFAISKEVFSKMDFDDVSPEKGEGFEDRIFFYTLCNKFPEKHKKFNATGVIERACATKDINSTWYTNQNIQQMLIKTENKIKENSK